MGQSPGRQLLTTLQRELVHSLHDAATALVEQLAALAPDPGWDGTPFDGLVLGPVEPADPVLGALAGLATDNGKPAVGLHGWRDSIADGAARGVAYTVRAADGLALVVSVTPSTPELTMRASGLTGQSITVALGNGWSLRVGGAAAGSLEVSVGSDGSPRTTASSPGDWLEVEFRRAGTGGALGVPGGPSVNFGTVTVGGRLEVTANGALGRQAWIGVRDGEVTLAPGFLAGVLPFDLTYPLDVDVRVEPGSGFTLAGSPSLRTRLSAAGQRWLDIAGDVVTAADGSAALRLRALTSVSGELPGAPVGVHVDGIGLELPIPLRRGAPILPDPAGLTAVEPDGVGVALALPVVSGSGAVAVIGDGPDLAGLLTVRIPPMSAQAFGVLTPAAGGAPLSFLVLIGATFPPPGIQIGFGFAVSGLGGVVGVNRRIDRDALIRAVTDGSAAHLLFPTDPAGAGPAAITALPSVFPAARGSTVAGPMFQLAWGGRIVTLSVAVLAESARQVRLTILGKLVAALPDPAAPLVLLQATFTGIVDPGEPSVMFVASLTGSHIVGARLSGDMVLLVRGGADPALVLSAGGFHPAFPVPRGVPALRRMALDLCPTPLIDLRCEAYFAITSNTLQLGARIDLAVEVAECGFRGYLAFDALVQLSPFRFVADVSGGVCLRAFGQSLLAVHLALHLEGPAPWLARGRGSLDLFLFEVSLDFEVGWGSPPPAPPAPPDVGVELRAALADPTAWTAHGATPPGLTLTKAAAKELNAATAVDPYGSVTVRQTRVPLGLEIARFAGVAVAPQRWDVTTGEFGPGEPASRTTEVRDRFAPGQFVASGSDDAALGAPAFVELRSGVELLPAAATGAETRPVELTWEERIIAHELPAPERGSAGALPAIAALELAMVAATAADATWWAPPAEVVAVAATPPVAAAFSWSMHGSPEQAAATALELGQSLAAAGRGDLMTVEAWEL